MGRQNVADGLAAQLRQVAGFDAVSSGTVSIGDERVLGVGISQAAIIMNDRFDHGMLANNRNTRMDWYFEVKLFIRYNNDIVQAREDSNVYTQAIIDRINANPSLGGSAFDAMVEAGRVEEEHLVIGKTPFLLEVLTVRATELF